LNQPAQETEEEMEKLKEAETVAAQRLRKTFKYPSESDDEDTVEAGMDEQGNTPPRPLTQPVPS
jgi:hypothetical protein